MEFDPEAVSYDALLETFWAGHDPGAMPWKRQYISAIFPHGEAQQAAAIRSRDREAARRGGRIFTEILPDSRFHPAEAYHQKFALRGKPALLKEYQEIYPDYGDFLASTAVARVNGYVGRHGTCATLRAEIDALGLSPAGRKALEAIVCPPGAEERAAPAAACPAGQGAPARR